MNVPPRPDETRSRRFACFAALVMVVGSLALPVSASVVEALPLRQLVQEADLVVVAQARSKSARRDGYGRIVTDVELTVRQSLAGDIEADDILVVTTLGGTMQDVGMHVEGAAELPVGERMLLFVRRTSLAGELRVVGMSQGALPLKDTDTGTVVMPGGKGQILMRRSSDGSLQPGQPALQRARPLQELLAEVRALIEDVHVK